MSKAKTNALDALRALIAERQQYEQWISAMEAKREGTPEHVFERVQSDYRNRLDRVVGDIRGHAEELQLSISTLSSRLVEVAREEDTRREGLQEAELRAAVGEYEPHQWQQLKSEAEESLGKIAADRASLDSQLGELRAIQKLSEVGSVGTPPATVEPSGTEVKSAPASFDASAPVGGGHRSGTAAAGQEAGESASQPHAPPAVSTAAQENVPLEPMAASAPSVSTPTSRQRPTRTPPGGVSAARAKSEVVTSDNSKTLKCPECGTANYPTEWYCERCGGELATM